jgi:hypothetical protein
MRILFVLFVILTLNACGRFDGEQMFKAHVTNVQPTSVRALQGGKVSCLHCPMYFSFETDKNLVAAIVSQHKLKQIDEPSEEIRLIERLMRQEVSWWPAVTERDDKIYWIEYKPINPAQESAFRLLVVKNKSCFFVTSGFFSNELYESNKA